MAIAIKTDSSVPPTITQQSLYDGIKQAFVNAGYSVPFDEFVSGTDKVLVYQAVIDASKTYGTAYLRIRVTTTFVVAQQILATWNTATKAGTGGATEVVYTALVANAAVNLMALNMGVEAKLILLYQGTVYYPLGYVSPSNRPSWWDLNAWPYAFVPTANTFTLYRSTTVNPFANTEHDTTLGSVRMGTANVISNRRDVLASIVFFTQANQGIVGKSSEDFAMVSATGLSRFDIFQTPTDLKQYLLLNPVAGGLALRIA